MKTVQDNCTDYHVRLVGGTTANEGRVQICLNNVWGTFCYRESYSYNVDANKICKEVGYDTGWSLLLVVVIIIFPGGEVYLAESPDAGNDVILIADMGCSETATSINQCSLTYYTKVSSCDARHTAAVRCHSTFYIIFDP